MSDIFNLFKYCIPNQCKCFTYYKTYT